MTGYAGSRDYVGTPQSPQKTSHISTFPTEKRLRTSCKNSVRVTYYFKLFATRRVFLREARSKFFSGQICVRSSTETAGSLHNPEIRLTPAYVWQRVKVKITFRLRPIYKVLVIPYRVLLYSGLHTTPITYKTSILVSSKIATYVHQMMYSRRT